MFTTHNREEIRAVFVKSLVPKGKKMSKRARMAEEMDEDRGFESDSEKGEEDADQEKHAEFKRGFSEYLLTKFYAKKKREAEKEGLDGKLNNDLKDKFKAIFDIINKQQEGDFMKKQI